MFNHLVLYDGTCGLCSWVVQFLLKVDRQKVFVFAPLDGPVAQIYLDSLPPQKRELDSVILIENYLTRPEIHILSQGPLRICWLLGRTWRLIGWLSFLPSFLFDWAYRIVAKNRYRLVSRGCLVPSKKDRNRFINRIK